MSEYLLAHMLEPVAIHKHFETWPLHITQIAWFETGMTLKELVSILGKAMVGFTAVSVEVGDVASYTSHNNVPIAWLDREERLTALHDRLQAVIDTQGFEVVDGIRTNTSSHIAHQNIGRVATAVAHKVNGLDLVQKLSETSQESVYRFYSL